MAAARLNPGERCGPLALDVGYSIVELLAKKLAPQLTQTALQPGSPFDARPSPVDAELARIAGEQNVTVNFDVLKTVPVTNISMFTVRYLGFGGTIPAVPQLEPMFNWYQLMKEESP